MSIPDVKTILAKIHRDLGIPTDYASTTNLILYPEVALSRLVVAQLDDSGRPLVMSRDAAEALCRMQLAARKDGIQLLPFSGFRSYVYQKGLIAAKLAKGTSINDILRVLAAPGYSEHHTGEAVDITTLGCAPAEEVFQETDAYRWLVKHATSYGFSESFPRNNPHNLVFEPWHWRFRV